MSFQSYRSSLVPLFSEGPSIPKIIHQTFPVDKLPDELEKNVARMRSANLDWDYRFYSDDDIVRFIREAYGAEILAYYERINPKYGAARADLFRYLLMYKFGGVYLDIKSSPEIPLDDIILTTDRYLLSRWDNGIGQLHEGWGLHPELRHVARGEFQQWFIVAAPGHPFLRAVILDVLRNIDCYSPFLHGTGLLGVIRVTGPIAYTLAIHSQLHLHPHRFADSCYELGFAYSIFGTGKTNAHKTLFKHNYTQLNEPIVRIGAFRKIADSGLRCLSKLRYFAGDRRTVRHC